MKKETVLSESLEQIRLVNWLEVNGYKFTAIPNATFTGWNQARKNRDEGVRAGLPDLLVLVKKKLVWIEMKRSDKRPKRGGKGGVSDEQRGWIDALNECENCGAFVCYSAEDAKKIIQSL